jgi:hypothetical protein
VEGGAEALELPEHPLPDLEQDVLTDRPGPHQEHVAGDRLGDGRDQHGTHDQQQGPEVVVLGDRRDAGVDADLDEERDRETRGVLDHHDQHQPLEGGGVGLQQVAEEPARAGGEPRGRLVGQLVAGDLVGGDATPRLLGAGGRHEVAPSRSASLSAASSSR